MKSIGRRGAVVRVGRRAWSAFRLEGIGNALQISGIGRIFCGVPVSSLRSSRGQALRAGKCLQRSRWASFGSWRGKTARFAALLATLVITSVTVNALIIAASQAR